MEALEIRRIGWEKTIPLRHRILWPNENPKFCRVDGDEDALHFGAFVADELVSVASVYLANDTARLRKFATLVSCQGKGIGSMLLRHILTELAGIGVSYLWCDARESAVGFYERFGMKPEGSKFYKGAIPYFKMGVELN